MGGPHNPAVNRYWYCTVFGAGKKLDISPLKLFLPLDVHAALQGAHTYRFGPGSGAIFYSLLYLEELVLP